MAEKRVHHIQLHQPAATKMILLLAVLIFGGGYGYFFYKATKAFDEPAAADPGPYSIDLRSEGAPVAIDYDSRYEHIIATVIRSDGKEIRLYDPYTGKLVGTYWEPGPEKAPSEEDESGAE